MGSADKVASRVRAWIESCLASRPEKLLYSSHLNEIGLTDRESARVDVWRQVFGVAVAEISAARAKRRVLLVASAGCDRKLITGDLPLARVLSLIDAEEPPSLYLQHERLAVTAQRTEEYRLPVSLDLKDLPREAYEVYFRQFRDEEELARNWEYSRALYFQSILRDERGRVLRV